MLLSYLNEFRTHPLHIHNQINPEKNPKKNGKMEFMELNVSNIDDDTCGRIKRSSPSGWRSSHGIQISTSWIGPPTNVSTPVNGCVSKNISTFFFQSITFKFWYKNI